MYMRWVGDNVDLDLLVICLKRYFKEKKFKVEEEKRENKRRIILCSLPYVSRKFKIIIEGDSEDFSIETFFKERKRSLMLLHGIYSLFGGGAFVLNEVKFEELMLNIEKDLKSFLEQIVPLLKISKEKKPKFNSHD